MRARDEMMFKQNIVYLNIHKITTAFSSVSNRANATSFQQISRRISDHVRTTSLPTETKHEYLAKPNL